MSPGPTINTNPIPTMDAETNIDVTMPIADETGARAPPGKAAM